MLFFDDMEKNVRDVAQLGVTTMHCPGGLTQDVSTLFLPMCTHSAALWLLSVHNALG
jgi:Acid Phosphatase